jgi:hypothetical protein
MDYKKITNEGSFKGAIKEIKVIKSRFEEEGYEIKITAITNDELYSEIYLDMSERFPPNQRGEVKKACQISMQAIRDLGFAGNDFTKLEIQMVGKPINFFTKLNAKGYLNAYISHHIEEQVSLDDANRIFGTLLKDEATGGF